MEQVLVDLVNNFPVESEEAALRAQLRSHHSKVLRSACVKLKLNPQRRTSGQNNKAGFIDLLCQYRTDKADREIVALTGPTKEGSERGEERLTQHDTFRILNVLFSPEFVGRMVEADRTQIRANVDKRSINENTKYWKNVAQAYNADRESYNAVLRADREQYAGIHPAEAAKHSPRKIMDVWRKLSSRYTAARGKSQLSNHNESDFWQYCQGRVDLLYLYDWLQVHPNLLDGGRGRFSKRAQMSTLDDSVDSDNSLPSAGIPSSKKRRRLTPTERLANMLEMKERQSGYEAVTQASTAVQSAITTLNMLKSVDSDEDLIKEAKKKVNVLVRRWMNQMDAV